LPGTARPRRLVPSVRVQPRLRATRFVPASIVPHRLVAAEGGLATLAGCGLSRLGSFPSPLGAVAAETRFGAATGGPIVLAEADVERARFRILRLVEHRFDPFSSRGRSRHAGFVFH